ncbi:hypothetical protein DXG01_006103 [Tephrocybe rancida]|nr:hypothetical protein DXG01_006103 [Tephrocybe rancida]
MVLRRSGSLADVPINDDYEVPISRRKDDPNEVAKAAMLQKLALAGFRMQRLPWLTLGEHLAHRGIRLRMWPHGLEFPGEFKYAGKGISSIPKDAARLLLTGLHDETRPIIFEVVDANTRGSKNNVYRFMTANLTKIVELQSSDEPVIIGAPPPPHSNHLRGRRFFANRAIDEAGLRRYTQSKDDSKRGETMSRTRLSEVFSAPPAKKRRQLERTAAKRSADELGEELEIQGRPPKQGVPAAHSGRRHNTMEVFITTVPPIRKGIPVPPTKGFSKEPTHSSGPESVAKRRRVESPIQEPPPHDQQLSTDNATGDDLLSERDHSLTPSSASHQRRATPSSSQRDSRYTTPDSTNVATPSPARSPRNSMDRHPVQQHSAPFIAPQQRNNPVKDAERHFDVAGPSSLNNSFQRRLSPPLSTSLNSPSTAMEVPEPEYLPQYNHLAQPLLPNTSIHVRPPTFHSNPGPSHLNPSPTLLQQNQFSDNKYNTIEANAYLNPSFNPTSFQLEPTNFMFMHGYDNLGMTQNLDYFSYGHGSTPVAMNRMRTQEMLQGNAHAHHYHIPPSLSGQPRYFPSHPTPHPATHSLPLSDQLQNETWMWQHPVASMHSLSEQLGADTVNDAYAQPLDYLVYGPAAFDPSHANMGRG